MSESLSLPFSPSASSIVHTHLAAPSVTSITVKKRLVSVRELHPEIVHFTRREQIHHDAGFGSCSKKTLSEVKAGKSARP